MIERHWKGTCKAAHAGEYEAHLLNDTLKQLSAINGFEGLGILKRVVNSDIEFLIITNWKSMEDIKHFAGSNIELAVLPLPVQEMMLNYDEKVMHYESFFYPGII